MYVSPETSVCLAVSADGHNMRLTVEAVSVDNSGLLAVDISKSSIYESRVVTIGGMPHVIEGEASLRTISFNSNVGRQTLSGFSCEIVTAPVSDLAAAARESRSLFLGVHDDGKFAGRVTKAKIHHSFTD